MSRSYRKPYFGNPESSKKWKKLSNQNIRHIEDIPDGNYYKKLNDVWTSPMEHKRGYSTEFPKLYRK